MNKVRLLLWETCHKNCEGCCNKDWNLDALPTVTESVLKSANIVMLTGGEPMLYPARVLDTIRWVRKVSNAEIYVYTAKVSVPEAKYVLASSDGMTVSLHHPSDIEPFLFFAHNCNYLQRSNRVNIFQGVPLALDKVPSGWYCKSNIEWVKDCPLPQDEVFVRLTQSKGRNNDQS